MQGKPLIMLAVAGTLGLGAMFLTNRLLNRKPSAEAPMRDVLVAVRDFNAEEIIKPEMVKTVQMAESAIPAGYFADAEDVVDRWVKTTLLEGEPIIERKLGPKGSPPGLVANIPKGMRAFAVEVNEQSGVSGFILPGHRVDVIRFGTGDKSLSRGETILQDVLVLASGQVFVKSDEKTLQSRTVTLAVSPDDVDMLVAAKAKGVLSLALRGVNDHDVVERVPEPIAEVDEGELKRRELEMRVAQLQQDRDSKQQQLESHKRELEAERRLGEDRGKELAKSALDLQTQTELARENAKALSKLRLELAIMEEKARAQTAGPVGYVYKTPGTEPKVYALRGKRGDPKPAAPRAPRPETPNDSEGPPVTSPASLVSGGLAASGPADRP